MSIESRRLRREERRNFKNFIPSTPEEVKYHEALKKVRKIKGFYTHLVVYIIINAMIIIAKVQKVDPGESIWHALYVPAFWGLGLLSHGLSVFLPGMILGQNWEERKIQELMDKEKNERKWE